MIELPFPPASLSGHNTGHWSRKAGVVQQHRQWAHFATLDVKYAVPPEGDIQVHVTFVPPDNRGDRINFCNRMKPYFDGIADALGVNDKRFVPHFYFCAPEAPGWVAIEIAA